MSEYPKIRCLEAGADVPAEVYGARASRLVKLLEHGLVIPDAYALSVDAVRETAKGKSPDLHSLVREFGTRGLVSVRSSPVEDFWGGPETMLNVGMNWKVYESIAKGRGKEAAGSLYCRFVQDYAIGVARLDPEDYEGLLPQASKETPVDFERALHICLALFEEEMEEPFPQNPAVQLGEVLRSMSIAWSGTSARILRRAKGAPADAGLGLIVQRMALGFGKGEFGSGVVQFANPDTGEAQITGRYLSQSQGRAAVSKGRKALFLQKDPRGPSLETVCPDAFCDLQEIGGRACRGFRDAVSLDFTVEGGEVWLLDVAPARRTVAAAVAIAVDLAESKVISKQEAVLRIEPRNLNELLHPQIDPKADRNIVAQGIGASPGAVTGKIVFSATAAQASDARDETCILVRVETSPEDIRGMHSARGVLTERGGMTSHAAVIARGLGLPCVVGASDMRLNMKAKTLRLANGDLLVEGDELTVDGTTGQALSGAPKLLQPKLGGAFSTLMKWVDQCRDIDVRANADTPHDARLARQFKVDGIGLCRTEHMFFEPGRLTVMREMIFADSEQDRRAALDQLLPMQRGDFVELFQIMQGLAVCIRLFDPPLHEFLPHSRDQMQALAEAMDIQVSHVMSRAEDLAEFNPMLGTRGVRLGITVPEIYDMQARAIFEAAVAVFQSTGTAIVPEIMIPLVSANKEVELVKARIDAVSAAVQSETGVALKYKLGVMVETPRAALRAGDLAENAAFLSFGTNDLTQMTYGLSRDDAGRFMSDYVNKGVYSEDPFHTLDIEGVGELLLLAAERGRERSPDIVLGLCGEHGGDPEAVAFCRVAGFDYVSCSAYRTPIARLAAAQAAIKED